MNKDEVLLTTLPFDLSYHVFVDGELVRTDIALSTFLCFNVPEGKHEIEIIYVPNGLEKGVAIGICCLLIAIGLWIISKYYKNNHNVEH